MTEAKTSPGALIAMSGGVDSSVAAYLTCRTGAVCQGVTMRLYRNEDLGLSRYHPCCSQQDVDDAAEVAFSLGMPFQAVDYTEAFREEVIEKFVGTYQAGGTPNPCIDCNRTMKFDRLLTLARESGLDCLVTGHYARIAYDGGRGRWLLKKGLDPAKDQSYVLYMLTQRQLAHVRLPLGDLRKAEVRRIAAEQGFCTARKRDSQDLCFVPDGDYVRFLERYTGRSAPPGVFLDLEGRVLGHHRGAVGYTLGQRRGLGLSTAQPVYVCKKSMAAGSVTVGPASALYTDALLADQLNWILFDALPEPLRVSVCTRYHQQEQAATASMTADGRLRLDFDEPQRAVTPGQAVVLYQGETVVGGGTIREAFCR